MLDFAKIEDLLEKYECVKIIDLSAWNENYEESSSWLENTCKSLARPFFSENQRIIFLHKKDYYVKNGDGVGIVLKKLQVLLNQVDIPNYFVIVMSSSENLEQEINHLRSINVDDVDIFFYRLNSQFEKISLDRYPFSQKDFYEYGSSDPIKIVFGNLTDREKFLLAESKIFCMYPWVHLHAWPTGQAFPCCHAKSIGQIGNCKTQSLKEIWNSDSMKQLRKNMLNEIPNSTCEKCYEQEATGFFSGRKNANKHHGHHIGKTLQTNPDGHLDHFSMTYWDIRFSNLCNLRCRSCGHSFSSQWYQDQSKLAGPEWKARNQVLNYAGGTELDMWEQLEPHLDYVEQIYFAGGEPLLMEEHYRILDELVKRKLLHVRLIYNTNFTHTDLKGRSVFEYWKQFESVTVGASLDGQDARGEYIRKGTDWAVVEQNRRDMLEICPQVDFYISPTLSIMNAWHLPDFHRNWVQQGLIRPQDLNVNILQDPAHYRIDIAPIKYKQRLRIKFEEHLEWLRDQDLLQRATIGFESAINFMMATDNTHLIDTFWSKTQELDSIRNEELLNVIPELEALK